MKSLRYIFLLAIVLLSFSCKKFKGSQEIPAYLRIEPWSLTTNYELEGAATEAITDAWVYLNGNLHGCFEFKNHKDGVYALLPVLEKGEKSLQLYPGVKMNGIASTRIQYPFYQPYKIKHTFVEGEIGTVAPTTKYYSIDTATTMHFKLMEDFEEINNIKFSRLDSTYAELNQISHRTNPNAWMDPLDTINHYRSGHVHVGDSIKRFRIVTGELANLPAAGGYVIMEMDYKCDKDILVGMYVMSAQNGLQDKELYYVKASDTWKKIYINFSPTVTDNYNALYFKIYIGGNVSGDETADFYFDNIKLICRE